MPNVYSVSLWQSGSVIGSVTGPTVPEGFVWVVRTITVQCQGALNTAQGLILVTWGGTFPIAGWTPLELYGQAVVSWDGHHVVPASQFLSASVSAPGAAQINVSGYQLTLP